MTGEAAYARNNEITAPRVRLATADGHPLPTLNARYGRTVVSVPLRAVSLHGARVAVCSYCGSRPDTAAARICTAVRCPLVKTDRVHGGTDK